MPEWDYKTRPDAFCNVPFAEVTGRIAALIEQYRPQVVITYDDKGLYQHPDHVYASQTAQAAVAQTGIPAKLYLTAMRGSDWQKMRDALREAGVDMPAMTLTDEQRRQAAAEEARITTTVDIRPVLARKRDALFAHASQIQESWFSQIPPELAVNTFGFEHFIKVRDTTGAPVRDTMGAPVPETDLFAACAPDAGRR